MGNKPPVDVGVMLDACYRLLNQKLSGPNGARLGTIKGSEREFGVQVAHSPKGATLLVTRANPPSDPNDPSSCSTVTVEIAENVTKDSTTLEVAVSTLEITACETFNGRTVPHTTCTLLGQVSCEQADELLSVFLTTRRNEGVRLLSLQIKARKMLSADREVA